MYIIYKYALNEIILFGFVSFWGFLRPWKLTFREHWMNFFCFCFFDDLLKLYFFYYMSQQNWWSGKKSIKSIFEGFFLSLKRKLWNLTLDISNTQKIELHANPCWRHFRNETISLFPSEQNLYREIYIR